MPKISVLTPSIRPSGLAFNQHCLGQQSLQDFEWLVELGVPQKGCDLSAAMNRMLRRAKGELIVIYQDYILIQPDGLQRFWELHQTTPRACITGPKGISDIWPIKDGNLRWDWRMQGVRREVLPNQWESDWACAPIEAFASVGGYDEEYDLGWSWENVEIALRMKREGFTFMVDPSNPSVGLNHHLFETHPFNRPENLNGARIFETERRIAQGEWKLGHLGNELRGGSH